LVVDEFDREAPDMDRCWQTVCRIEKRLFVGVVVCKLGYAPAFILGDASEVVSVCEEFGVNVV
jgi:hypothetical protein